LLRKLGQGVWYEVRTRINNREPLFRRARALTIFARVFRETGLRFVFEVRGLHLEDDWLTFYIKPEDGLELPEVEEGDGSGGSAARDSPLGRGAASGVRPCWMGREGNSCFPLIFPLPTTPSPG
jgi:hypothetical protein